MPKKIRKRKESSYRTSPPAAGEIRYPVTNGFAGFYAAGVLRAFRNDGVGTSTLIPNPDVS